MKAILEKAEIKNFKGIISLTANFKPTETVITGDNSTGKSSIYDACMWCLTGKLSNGSSTTDFKPYDKFNKTIHHIENEVVLTYSIDGEKKVLKRKHNEKWGSPRGVKGKVLTGHNTTYYIDDVPKKQKEFDLFIDSTFGLSALNILSSPLEVNTIHWEKRRDIVMSLSEGIDDITLASNLSKKNKDYDYVLEFLQEKVLIEDQKKKLKAQISELKKDRDELPVRIDEVAKDMIHDVDKSQIDSQILEFNAKVEDIEKQERSGFEAYESRKKEESDIASKISELKIKKRDWIREIEDNAVEKNKQNVEDRSRISGEIADFKAEIRTCESQIAKNKKTVQDCQLEIGDLRIEYRNLISQVYVQDPNSTICPTCKRELDDSAAISENLEHNFNSNKAKQLEKNTSEGKRVSAKIKSLLEENETLDKSIKNYQEAQPELHAALTAIELFEPSFDDEKMKSINDSIAEFEKSLSLLEPIPTNNDLLIKKNEIKGQISELSKKANAILENDKRVEKIKAYTAQISNVEDNIILIEKQYDIIESFEKAKYSFIEDEVNNKFKLVKFKLWDYHINGSNKPCCVATVGGVPFEMINTAGKVKAGLDIISTLSNHFSKYIPVWIDNRESVVEIPPMETQVINMVVVKGQGLEIK